MHLVSPPGNTSVEASFFIPLIAHPFPGVHKIIKVWQKYKKDDIPDVATSQQEYDLHRSPPAYSEFKYINLLLSKKIH